MIFVLHNVLPTTLLDKLKSAFDSGAFVDAAQTVGVTNIKRKRNEEHQTSSALRKELSDEVRQSLQAHNVFNLTVQSKRVGDVLLIRYRKGMFYGSHIDNTVMNCAGTTIWRSDL